MDHQQQQTSMPQQLTVTEQLQQKPTQMEGFPEQQQEPQQQESTQGQQTCESPLQQSTNQAVNTQQKQGGVLLQQQKQAQQQQQHKKSPQQPQQQKRVHWEKSVEEAFLEAVLSALNYTAKRDLERRVRSGSGTEERGRMLPSCCAQPCGGASEGEKGSGSNLHAHAHEDSSCCKNNDSNCAAAPSLPVYRFKKDPEDHLGGVLDKWTSPQSLCELLSNIAERASVVYDNMKAKGEAEGLELPAGAEERHLRMEILREATIREIQLRVCHEIRVERQRESLEGGLLAIPSAYKGHLSHLHPETVRALMKEGVAVQHGFVGESLRKKILKDVELIEYDGRFNEVLQQSMHHIRKDYTCWVTQADLDREAQQGLWQLMDNMKALPYELNCKAALCLQVSWVFQLAVFQADAAYYKAHLDSGFAESLDTGRKITALYFPNAPDWKPLEGATLRVYNRWTRRQQLASVANNEVAPFEKSDATYIDVLPKGDTLVLLRSREMPYEITPAHRKCFSVCLWMSGPAGPGDDI